MNILALSAFYHDSAACLVQDGEIISAVQEERFTRKKYDFSFPENAIRFCLENSNLEGQDLDYVAFYEKPFIRFERILETYLSYAPFGIKSFIKAMPLWLKQKLWIKEIIKDKIGYQGNVIFPEHHQSHAASAFYPSPFHEAAFLTIDGVGEWTTSSYGIGKGSDITIIAEQKFPHSLGLLYSAFTYYIGFKVNSGEYKVMGLAPYGEPEYKDIILSKLVDLKKDGSFRLNMDYFNYCVGLTMTNKRFHRLFGGPPRKPESEITQREMNIARSIQDVTEDIMIRMASYIHNQTKQKHLCLAGGVALNCVANGRILREGPFEDIWVQPAAGDAGSAIGAALFVWYKYLGNMRNADGLKDFQKNSYLGPKYENDYVEDFLTRENIAYRKLESKDISNIIADLIDQQKIIGWFQGKMEFGPRALGSRSIIGDARSPKMQQIMNRKIKFRESFRPFAPSVIKEKADEFFEIEKDSPYMLFVAPITKQMRTNITEDKKKLTGLDKLKVVRSQIPAVTHVDYSARIQTVDKKDNPLYYETIKSFYYKTSCPVIINTSFNVRGEPIVCTPEDAYLCFMKTNMDYLIIGNFLLAKEDQSLLEATTQNAMKVVPD
ncbi:MAG: carbamoyltransferase [Planctomycetes bacterium]|nr:carbamoyltransferase [Planctomycetota bacterium]